MGQDNLFFQVEGENWFRRNRVALEAGVIMDWPAHHVGTDASLEADLAGKKMYPSIEFRCALLKKSLDTYYSEA